MPVNLVAAVIHGKAHQGMVACPMGLDQLRKHAKGMGVVAQFFQRFRALGSILMHNGIIICVVHGDKIVPIFYNQLAGLGIDLLHRIINVIVHLPFQKNMGHAVTDGGDQGDLFSAANQGIEQGIDPNHRLDIGLNAMNLRLGAGVHGSKAHRRDGGHHRTERDFRIRMLLYFLKQMGIFLINPLGNGVRIVHKDSCSLLPCQRFVHIAAQLSIGRLCLVRSLYAHGIRQCACKGG